LFLLYVENKFFWAQQNLGGTKDLGYCPQIPPCGYGSGLKQQRTVRGSYSICRDYPAIFAFLVSNHPIFCFTR